jgi:RNA recognition motif-containing protein
MNIYVGNLSYSITEGRLVEIFGEFGSVTEGKIVIDRDTGRSKGFGFVEMSNQSEGEEAIKRLDGKEIDGRNLKVNEAKPKADRPRSRGPRY